jgi:hypothetical protein
MENKGRKEEEREKERRKERSGEGSGRTGSPGSAASYIPARSAHGFCAFVERICAMQAGDRGFTTVLTMTFPTAKRFEADRNKAFADFATLVERAKAAGKLRADFVTEDMPVFLMANAGVLAATADAAPHTWCLLVGYLTQACAAAAAQPLPDPPRPRQMYRAMLRSTRH